MVGNVASLSLAANLCDDEEEHLRGKVLRAMRLPPDDAYVNVNADALARNKPREDTCTAIRWRRMIGSTYHLRVVAEPMPSGLPSDQRYQRSTHCRHFATLSFAVPLIPFLSSLVVPISAASGALALLFSLLVVSSYRILHSQLLSQQLGEDRGDGHTFAIDIFISSLAGS